MFEPCPAAPLPALRVRLRERRHACGAYIRKVKGEKYQLRWWLEVTEGGSINCGLYNSEWEAERVRGMLEQEVLKVAGRGKTALSLWAAMKPLIAKGVIPQRVLPKYVRRCEEGFVGVVKREGEVRVTELFTAPEDAHRAMMEMLKPDPPVMAKRVSFIRLFDFLSA